MQAELVFQSDAQLGEGAIWDAASNRLYWVDILGFALHIFDPASGADRAIPVGEHIGTVVPWAPGKVLVALRERIAAVDLASGAVTTFISLPPQPTPVRFNDGKCDPAGRFWVGTMSMKGLRNAGTLYSLAADGTLVDRLHEVSTSNGIVWTSDGRRMYYIDTPTGGADAFDYDAATGAIANRRRAVTFPPNSGHPDGMAIDAEDCIWIAHWAGACVSRWDPATGRELARIEVPAMNVTSCAFGGPDLATLYITTARTATSPRTIEKYPLTGSLFAVVPGVRGVPADAFRTARSDLRAPGRSRQ